VAYNYALMSVGVEAGREMLLQMLKLWGIEWSDGMEGVACF
jgi:hypothetical protein